MLILFEPNISQDPLQRDKNRNMEPDHSIGQKGHIEDLREVSPLLLSFLSARSLGKSSVFATVQFYLILHVSLPFSSVI